VVRMMITYKHMNSLIMSDLYFGWIN
jgi:hypothetical protein